MNILDKYIIKNYLGTLAFMLGLLAIIVLVIDVQSKTPRIEGNGMKVSYFLVNYYPFWLIYLIITFMSILVFVTVIFFTSRLANNTEIVAYISSGASFHRFARPYLFASLMIGFTALMLNHFVVPWANIKKNKLGVYTYNAVNREKFMANREVSSQITQNEFIFINSYNPQNKKGTGYKYQKFDKNKKLIHQIIASEVAWDEKKKLFILNNFLEKTATKTNTDLLKHGDSKTQDFHYGPEELFPNELLGENKTTPELIKFIDREREKGNGNINSYLNELYQRTSMPVAIIILSFLALSLSSQKKRGGLGINLTIGIALAFMFVFSFEALKVVSAKKIIPPLLAMWLPNIIYAPLTLYLYFKRAND